MLERTDNVAAPSGVHGAREGAVEYWKSKSGWGARLGQRVNVSEPLLNVVKLDQTKSTDRFGAIGYHLAWWGYADR